MGRLCTHLRSIASQSLLQSSSTSTRRLLHHSAAPAFAAPSPIKWSSPLNRWPFTNLAPSWLPAASCLRSPLPLSLVQVRHVSSRDRRSKRTRTSPLTSKVKKIKLKPYSSYKSRFRVMNDGQIRRWREGKLHNAHLKSKKSKRRLRQPALVPAAYAKVMKKLNFCA